MKINFNRGFTLIELLVVIAIIGILSSVVLASLNTARTKGADAAVKSNLNNMRSQAELFYGNNTDSYGVAFAEAACAATAGTLFADPNIIKAINAAISAAGAGASSVCSSTTQAYAISVSMKTVAQSWCIDSSGVSKLYSTAPGTPAAAVTNSACT